MPEARGMNRSYALRSAMAALNAKYSTWRSLMTAAIGRASAYPAAVGATATQT